MSNGLLAPPRSKHKNETLMHEGTLVMSLFSASVYNNKKGRGGYVGNAFYMVLATSSKLNPSTNTAASWSSKPTLFRSSNALSTVFRFACRLLYRIVIHSKKPVLSSYSTVMWGPNPPQPVRNHLEYGTQMMHRMKECGQGRRLTFDVRFVPVQLHDMVYAFVVSVLRSRRFCAQVPVPFGLAGGGDAG